MREQKTENRGQRTENREQRTENREQRTEVREQRSENRGADCQSAKNAAGLRPAKNAADWRSAQRPGISLLEVLAAIGVLSIGLLALASLLPVGRYTLSQALVADRAGACGRAAIRDIIVRRMLDSNNWTSSPGNAPSFIIDPEGVTNGMGSFLASAPANGSLSTRVPRIGLTFANTQPLADAVCRANDDLVVNMPDSMNQLPAPYNQDPHGRPLNITSTGSLSGSTTGTLNPLQPANQYSWFATVTPEVGNPTRFSVSVVVCYNRNLAAPTGERAVLVSAFGDAPPTNPSVALGGGALEMSTSATYPSRPLDDAPSDIQQNCVANIQVRENEWVALVNSAGLCRWYRVASLTDYLSVENYQSFTVVGPDWLATPGSDVVVSMGQSVVGVYTTTVELDTDPLWKN
jgi:hypothetical protein